jgi:hypothetical protein
MRELSIEEIEAVSGGSVREGWADIREGINDLVHGNREGWQDIGEGIHDILTAGHRK